MHAGMKLTEMLEEVVRQNETKRDFIADTKDNIAMVPMPDFPEGVAIVLNRPESGELERFSITDNFHQQLSTRLQIPKKYYLRLLQDHRDLLLQNVNTLFQREPKLRLVRTLDGKARAFLSDRYRRVDNEQILEATLPVVKSEFDTRILNTWVDDDRMRFKCLFAGDEHKIDLGTKNGRQNTLHTGFEMGNSETGGGAFYLRGFTWSSYCTNGCVFGVEETVSYRQVHIGSRLGIGKEMLLSNETMQREDELIISATRDVLTHIASPQFTQDVARRIEQLRNGRTVTDAHASVEAVCKELNIGEAKRKGVLEAFIREQDYSQWGMVNAITYQGNVEEDYVKASEFEELGNKIINLPANRWNRIAQLEAVAA